MDYPHQTRLKIIGHAQIIDPGIDSTLEALLTPPNARLERILTLSVVAFDWNCPQHITPRFTMNEIEKAFSSQEIADEA